MSQSINTNIASLNAQRNLSGTSSALNTALQRLSSGLRINSAKDDAAGLAIAERMTSQVRGMDQARRNANDGVSLAQVGEGALNQMSDILQRIRELAVQSANATNSSSDRAAMNSEVGQLVAELQRFAQSTEFNGTKLFDGTFGSAIYQVGANANQTITTTTTDFRTNQYGTYQIGNALTTGGVGLSNGVSGTGTGAAISGAAVSTGGTVTINGPAGSANITTTTGDSAQDIAAKINAKSTTGVRASARTETTFDVTTSGSYTLQVFTSNAAGIGSLQNLSFSISNPDTADGLTQAVNAFNDASSKTGITARLNDTNDAVVLTADDGSSINIGVAATGNAAGNVTLGNLASTVGSGSSGTVTAAGQVTLDSSKSYSVTTAAGVGFTAGVLATGTVGGAALATTGANLQMVQGLDVSTVANSTNALRIVDSALDAINGQRAKFGALQSRFEATIANLQTSVENLSASRSRIRDTDFAAETAALSRAQVLQQAGTAMLAQANALPQNVLSLLK